MMQAVDAGSLAVGGIEAGNLVVEAGRMAVEVGMMAVVEEIRLAVEVGTLLAVEKAGRKVGILPKPVEHEQVLEQLVACMD